MSKICETIVPAYDDGSGEIRVSLNRGDSDRRLYVAVHQTRPDQLITIDANRIEKLIEALQAMMWMRDGDRPISGER